MYENQKPGERACARLPFDKNEAAAFKELLAFAKDKPWLQALLCTTMDVAHRYVQLKQIEKAMPLVPKTKDMVRASPIGMFYPAPPAQTGQNHPAST